MSNITRNFTVPAGLPYKVGVRSWGKEDLVRTLYGSVEEATISRDEMQNYVLDGIAVTPVINDNKAVIDFSNVKLPWKFEHSDRLLTSRFAIAPYGTTVTQPKYVGGFNGTTIGNVQISEDSIASGFSSSNYLRVPSQSFGSANNWEILFKVKTGSNTVTDQKVFHTCSGTGASGRYGLGINIVNNTFELFLSSNNSSWLFDLTGSYRVLPNTTYYIKASFSGTQYKLSYSLDNVTFIDDIIYDSTSKVYSSLPNAYIAVYSTSSFSDYWLGTIDLNECYIKINGEEVWRGSKWVNSRFNGTKVGSPTVDENYVVTNFSNSQYISTTLFTFNDATDTFKVDTYVKLSALSNYTFIFTSSSTSWGAATQSSMWKTNSSNGNQTGGSVATNRWYHIVLEQTGDSSVLYVDGQAIINAGKCFNSGDYINFGKSNWEPFYNGFIDFSQTSIQINGEEVWRGVEDLGTETLKGCIRYYYGEGEHVTTPPRDSTQYYNVYAVNGDEGIVLDSTYFHEGTMVYNRPIVTGGEIPQFENEWYLGEYRVETGEEGYIFVPIPLPDDNYFNPGSGGGIVLT